MGTELSIGQEFEIDGKAYVLTDKIKKRKEHSCCRDEKAIVMITEEEWKNIEEQREIKRQAWLEAKANPPPEDRAPKYAMATSKCLREDCGNPVPVSRNPGQPRKFCSTRCRMTYNSRRQAAESGRGKPIVEYSTDGQFKTFLRNRNSSVDDCIRRLDQHRENAASCPFGKTNIPSHECPGFANRTHLTPAEWARYYGTDYPGRCLIKAVLEDDMIGALAKKDNTFAIRLDTTVAGEWIDWEELKRKYGSEQIEKMDKMRGDGVPHEIVAFRPVSYF